MGKSDQQYRVCVDSGEQADPRSACSREYYINIGMIKIMGLCAYVCVLATAAHSQGSPVAQEVFTIPGSFTK